MRKILIANWKMHKTLPEAMSYCAGLDRSTTADMAIAAPYTLIRELAGVVGPDIAIGAQNLSEYAAGAYTGEISCRMLKDAGAKFAIIGHSERRQLFGETNEQVRAKIERAVVEGMAPLLCIGENEAEKDAGRRDAVLTEQLRIALDPEIFMSDELAYLKIAYEPIWAIGTGRSASIQEIDSAHQHIRDELKEMHGEEIGGKIPILYGGSVNADNVQEIFRLSSVDGALVGGASIDVLQFNEIIAKVRV